MTTVIDHEDGTTAQAADRRDGGAVQAAHAAKCEPSHTSHQVSETDEQGGARPYINRRKVAIALAPVGPACFSTRAIWLEYVGDAATAQHMRRNDGPLRWAAKGGPEWNPLFCYCRDCPAVHQGRMLLAGRCDPQHLLKLAAAEAQA